MIRSDVRAVSLSSDGLQVATCSTDGVKIWSTRLHTCLRTCNTGYGVSVAFAPGGRYVITGTKEGKLQVSYSHSHSHTQSQSLCHSHTHSQSAFGTSTLPTSSLPLPRSNPSPALCPYISLAQVVDTASGALVVDLQAHEGALWSLAVRPDGKGFVTASADKEVKFWDFTVSPVYVCVTIRQDSCLDYHAAHHVLCPLHAILPFPALFRIHLSSCSVLTFEFDVTHGCCTMLCRACRWRQEEC